jgi:hypothetical protein
VNARWKLYEQMAGGATETVAAENKA